MRGRADAIDNPNSFDRVPTYWLPTIRALGVNVSWAVLGAREGADERAGAGHPHRKQD